MKQPIREYWLAENGVDLQYFLLVPDLEAWAM
jgi:hypothetical protein